jgi:hypothetical protein
VIRAGGRVVKNVAGFDITRLMTGAWGTLGAITELHLRLRARPAVDESFAVSLDYADALDEFARGPFAPLGLTVLGAHDAVRLGAPATTTALVRLGGNAAFVAASRDALARLGRVAAVDAVIWDRVRAELAPPSPLDGWRAHPLDSRVKAAFDPSDLFNRGLLARAEGLREICDKHGILLIFDEVITGFGRTGSPFAATTFGVTPDLMTLAKGLTGGAVPMGAVLAKQALHDVFMTGPEHMIEFAHGYTYSAHPLACAAGLATLETYADEGLLTRAAQLQAYFGEQLHSLRGEPNVIDIRNFGLVGGVELTPIAGEPTKRALAVFLDCYDKGVMLRYTGDILAISPPLIIEREQIDQIVDTLRGAIQRAA